MATSLQIDTILERVRDYVKRSPDSNAVIGDAVGVDEKTVREVKDSKWNPRVRTLRRFEDLLPRGWRRGHPVVSVADRPNNPRPTNKRAAARQNGHAR